MLPFMRYLKKSGVVRGGVRQRLLMYCYDVRITISSVLMKVWNDIYPLSEVCNFREVLLSIYISTPI